MARDLARASAGQCVVPPLQPDLAGERLVGDLRDPGNLEVEGIERMKMRPAGRRCKQGRNKTILVGRPHQRFAVRVGCLTHRTLTGQRSATPRCADVRPTECYRYARPPPSSSP